MASWQPVVAVGDLHLQIDGTVMCGAHDQLTDWCEHLADNMISNGDQAIIWDIMEGQEKPEKWDLQIPVFPTNDLFETVTLNKLVSYNTLRWIVEWDIDPLSPSVTLGLLNRGEGRNVVRRLMVEYMWSATDNQAPQCKASTHSLPQENLYIRETHPSSKHRAMNVWSVWREGMCIPCMVQTNQLIDLVPDKEGSPW